VNIGELRRRFRRSLNHTPQPVPFISELFDAKVRVKDTEALTLEPLPVIRHQTVEVEGKKVYIIHPDDLSFLCFSTQANHEYAHSMQVYSPEGLRIYKSFEEFIDATKNAKDFKPEIEYRKLEIHPTLQQYFQLTFSERHLAKYTLYGIWFYLKFARVVEKYGKELGKIFRMEVKKNEEHKEALKYEKYLSFFEGSAFNKYYELLYTLYYFTFSNYDFKFFLRKKITDDTSIKELGIDLEGIKSRLIELKKKISGNGKSRVEFLLNHIPKGSTVNSFWDELCEFADTIPKIIYARAVDNRTSRTENREGKRHYAIFYKSNSRLWLGYYIDLSIAFQIRRVKMIKEREDPRRQVRCPFSRSEQFKKCEGCYGLLYPEIDFRGCKFLKEWKRSEGLKALYG